MQKNFANIFITLICLFTTLNCNAKSNSPKLVVINMYTTESNPKIIGSIKAQDSANGLLLTTYIYANYVLKPGLHGFHMHTNPSCANFGQAAGAHFDPQHTNSHLGPYNNGHLGDLPELNVKKDGSINQVVVAPRLKLNDIFNHSFIIHQGADNYSDKPLPLGGGGTRKICGITPPINS